MIWTYCTHNCGAEAGQLCRSIQKAERYNLRRDWAADRVSNAVGAQILASLKRRPHFQGLFPRLLLAHQLKQGREAAHTCRKPVLAKRVKLCTVMVHDRVGTVIE